MCKRPGQRNFAGQTHLVFGIDVAGEGEFVQHRWEQGILTGRRPEGETTKGDNGELQVTVGFSPHPQPRPGREEPMQKAVRSLSCIPSPPIFSVFCILICVVLR